MRGERRSSHVWEQKTPAELQDRSGFLQPEYPSNGLVLPFLLYTCEYAAAPKQERKGKHERGQFTSSEENKMQPAAKNIPVGLLCQGKGAAAGRACKESWLGGQLTLAGALRESPAKTSMGKRWIERSLEISPCRKGRTSSSSHQISAPYTQAGPGSSLSPGLLSNSNRKRGQLFAACHFGEG